MKSNVGLLPAAEPVAAEQDIMPLRDLVAEIGRRREEFDRLSHVPRDVVRSMKRAGIFRAATPKRFGGDARPPHEFLRMIEAIAVADGSAAWVAAFGSANTYLAALPIEIVAAAESLPGEIVLRLSHSLLIFQRISRAKRVRDGRAGERPGDPA